MSTTPNPVVTEEADLDVTESSDAKRAQYTVERIAADIGFADDSSTAIGLVANELVANVHKHAGSGRLLVKQLEKESESGIRLETHDAGPGIEDVETAFTSGASTAGSLGLGLSIANSTMDDIRVTTPSGSDTGTKLVTDRWLSREYDTTYPAPASIGAAARAIGSDEPNGDAFVLKTWNDKTLVGVIDGLGHGQRAHKASTTARNYIESHADRSLKSIFEGTDRACQGTRGVVMALARFDWSEGTLTFGNVGNITVKVSGPEWSGLLVRRGVIGGNNPGVSVVTRDWNPSYTMVLHSDGISTRWDRDEIIGGGGDPAGTIANRLLKQHGKSNDDATAVVVTRTHD